MGPPGSSHGAELSPSQQCPNIALCPSTALGPNTASSMGRNDGQTAPASSHPPERGQARLREAKGLLQDRAREKGEHTCVCPTQVSTHLPSHALTQQEKPVWKVTG